MFCKTLIAWPGTMYKHFAEQRKQCDLQRRQTKTCIAALRCHRKTCKHH